jgi:hypothetical protein
LKKGSKLADAGLRRDLLKHTLRANGLFFKTLLPTHLLLMYLERTQRRMVVSPLEGI